MSEMLDRLQSCLADRYAIARELGRGGMATVFLAKDVKHDRDVAIKVLHPELATSIGADRFEREIRLAARLQHPHILGMYDSGEADGLLYYVMPFVEGESLRDRIDREGQLPVEEAVQIALEVADALGHAHVQNVVHRDIKPENILLANGHALVADFGIARAATEGTQKLTQTGMSVGTPLYMAPEQAMGEPAGPTADLYSLGCVLYEMLAGDPPFTGKNAQAILARHAMEVVPSISIVRASVPDEVEEAIHAALGKLPADRPQSAARFAEILGVPMGATATRRVAMRTTAMRRVPTSPGMRQGALVTPWWRRPLVVVPAGALLVAGAFAAWRVGGGTPAVQAAGAGGLDPHRVAVLYFADESRDGTLGYLADGLTEGLITSLRQVDGLAAVISRSGVEPYRGTAISDDSVARALEVGILVKGDVERDGDQIKINLQLVDGASGSTIERASFRQGTGGELGARDSLVQLATSLIRTRLGEEIRLRSRRAGTTNVEAWSQLQRAEQVRKRGEAAAGAGDLEAMGQLFSQADSLLAEVERLDPSWAEPAVLRGLIAYQRSRLASRDPFVIKGWIDQGRAHADRALALDPNDPAALEVRGNLRYWGWLVRIDPEPRALAATLDSAQRDLERATALNRSQAGAWATLSHLYYQVDGKTPLDVRDAARAALQADAFLSNADVVLNRLFLASYDLGFFPDADSWCAELRQRFPDNLTAPRCELYLHTTTARTPPDLDRVWAVADSVVAKSPEQRRPYQQLSANMLAAAAIARASQEASDPERRKALADSARRVRDRSQGDAISDPTRELLFSSAFVSTLLGDKDQAFEALRTYLAANEQRRQSLVKDPGWWFTPLVSDPRWGRFIAGL